MKIVSNDRFNIENNTEAQAENEALQLAVELYEYQGEAPEVDIDRIGLRHWNGFNISVGRHDLTALQEIGYIDDAGDWTHYGREELARLADGELAVPQAAAR